MIDRVVVLIYAVREEPRGRVRVWHASDVVVDGPRELILDDLLILGFLVPPSCEGLVRWSTFLVRLRAFINLLTFAGVICQGEVSELHSLLVGRKLLILDLQFISKLEDELVVLVPVIDVRCEPLKVDALYLFKEVGYPSH